MIKKNKLIKNVLLFAIVFLLAYSLGLGIINLINQRLENVSINMPSVRVESPQVNILYDDTNKTFRPYNLGKEALPSAPIEETPVSSQYIQSGGGNLLGIKETTVLSPLPPLASCSPLAKKDCDCTMQMAPKEKIEIHARASHSPRGDDDLKADLAQSKDGCQTGPGRCVNDGQCNVVYGRGANRCVAGRCQCRFGGGDYCQNKPTYYLDPSQMTPAQVVKFKAKARLENMTLQDYTNWLTLFAADLENLPLVHRKNYWRLKKGLTVKFIPLNSHLSDPAEMADNYNMDGATSDINRQTMDSYYGGKLEANGSITPAATGGRGPGGQPAGMPDDERLFRIWGGRRLAPAGINPTNDDLVEVNLRLPAVEVDTSNNYRLTDNHMNTTGYIDQLNRTRTPLQWANYSLAFQPNRKYVEYKDKVTPFKTTLVSSWYQNRGPELSDLIESTYFDPQYRCN